MVDSENVERIRIELDRFASVPPEVRRVPELPGTSVIYYAEVICPETKFASKAMQHGAASVSRA
jgi:hypothetical protein